MLWNQVIWVDWFFAGNRERFLSVAFTTPLPRVATTWTTDTASDVRPQRWEEHKLNHQNKQNQQTSTTNISSHNHQSTTNTNIKAPPLSTTTHHRNRPMPKSLLTRRLRKPSTNMVSPITNTGNSFFSMVEKLHPFNFPFNATHRDTVRNTKCRESKIRYILWKKPLLAS